MDARVLIETLQSRGLSVFLARDKVRVEAPQEPDEDTKALLQQLREHRDEVKTFLTEEDPILNPEHWYPEFHRFHIQVVQETPNLDWQWLREQRPDLYQSIKTKENELDGLQEARLSQVMDMLRQWRGLILQAESERQGTNEQKQA